MSGGLFSDGPEGNRRRIVPPVQETFTEAIEFTSEFTQRGYPNLAKHLDPIWIEEALQSTGTGTLRRRRLPAEQIVWLVLGRALYRDLPITEVARRLDIALPDADGTRTVASSALSQARARLGADPLDWLFLRTGEEWEHASAGRDRWRGLALYGVDGTTLRVADSQVNRDHFGGQNAGTHAGGREERVSGYPSLRLVVLMALRSHLLTAASFGPYTVAEPHYAKSLWAVVWSSSAARSRWQGPTTSIAYGVGSQTIHRHSAQFVALPASAAIEASLRRGDWQESRRPPTTNHQPSVHRPATMQSRAANARV